MERGAIELLLYTFSGWMTNPLPSEFTVLQMHIAYITSCMDWQTAGHSALRQSHILLKAVLSLPFDCAVLTSDTDSCEIGSARECIHALMCLRRGAICRESED